MSTQQDNVQETEEKMNMQQMLVGAGGALLPFLPLELFGMGGAAFIAGAVGGVVSYVYASEVTDFVQNRLPALQKDHDTKRLKQWLLSRPGEDGSTRLPEETPDLQGDESRATHVLPEINAATQREETFFTFDSDEEVATLKKSAKKLGLFVLSELLDDGFVPSIKKIFVGRRMDTGEDIFVAAEDLCHVALSGKTGGGKGSLMRLIMVQLCYIGAKVLLLNPHYMRWVVAKDGPEFDEDWSPFEGINPRTGKPYLEISPMECSDYAPIDEYLVWLIETLLQSRRTDGREGGKLFRPYFIVLDEWPDVVDEVRGAAGRLSKLLRQGRKYGIFVIVASQDFQVKTTGLEGGSIRKCLLTTYYLGGDPTSVKELLSEPGLEVNENKLGKGIVYLKCVGTGNKPVLVYVPFVDNEAVYRLLGPSTFNKKQEDAMPMQQEAPISNVSAMPVQTLVLPPEQQITLSYAQLQALMSGQTNVLPDLQNTVETPVMAKTEKCTDDLPTELTGVVSAPLYSREIVMYPPTRKPSTALSPQLEKVLAAYNQGYTTSREIAAVVGMGKTRVAELMQQLKARKLIN